MKEQLLKLISEKGNVVRQDNFFQNITLVHDEHVSLDRAVESLTYRYLTQEYTWPDGSSIVLVDYCWIDLEVESIWEGDFYKHNNMVYRALHNFGEKKQKVKHSFYKKNQIVETTHVREGDLIIGSILGNVERVAKEQEGSYWFKVKE